MSKQLAAIMHHPDFQKLEGTWRGLQLPGHEQRDQRQLKIKVLNVSKRELFKDVDKAVEFDQSQIFKKLYENEFGTPGGEPYGALIGDYEFTNHPEDIDLLGKMSQRGRGGVLPVHLGRRPQAVRLRRAGTSCPSRATWRRSSTTIEYTKWKSFRDSEDSRFVTLVMPRVLARLPYGADTKPIEEFDFEEVELDARARPSRCRTTTTPG